MKIIINTEKKYVLLRNEHYEYKKECAKEDTFDWEVGLGLALSGFLSTSGAFVLQCTTIEGKHSPKIDNYRIKVREITKEKGKKDIIKEYKEFDYINYGKAMAKWYFGKRNLQTKKLINEALENNKVIFFTTQEADKDLTKIINNKNKKENK
nr:MAG TPA: hypothetical protein [Caudoviricetes sp.]